MQLLYIFYCKIVNVFQKSCFSWVHDLIVNVISKVFAKLKNLIFFRLKYNIHHPNFLKSMTLVLLFFIEDILVFIVILVILFFNLNIVFIFKRIYNFSSFFQFQTWLCIFKKI